MLCPTAQFSFSAAYHCLTLFITNTSYVAITFSERLQCSHCTGESEQRQLNVLSILNTNVYIKIGNNKGDRKRLFRFNSLEFRRGLVTLRTTFHI